MNKFKELTQTDIDYIRVMYTNKSLSFVERVFSICNQFDISERTVRRWAKQLKLTESPTMSQEYNDAANRKLKRSQTYLLTWAQNATPVHPEMWKNMLAYAQKLDAEIHVIAGRYQNPTSVFSDNQKKQDWWHRDVAPYLDAGRHKIHEELTVLSDLKIHPTAIYPLSGLEGLSKGGSIIVGTPKIHLQPFPVLSGENPKFAIGTGAVTLPNYTDSKAGKRGEFFHMYGFTIVEVDGDEFYFRQVPVCDDGSFIDLDVEVKNQTISPIDSIATIILGDVHESEIDEDIEHKTFAFLDIVKPNYTILHDLFNGRSISHHDKKDPVKMHQKYLKGEDFLQGEIENMFWFIQQRLKYNLVVVPSNHNDWLDRWISSEDWKKDLRNSLWYAKLLTIALEGRAEHGLIHYLIEDKFGSVVTCLKRDQSFKIKGYELAYHGDQGQNGSKGNLKQFARLNTKVVVGDYHSGARIDGAIGVGTMTPLRLSYNKGASSWNNSHAIIHHNGKVQHLIFKKNKRFSKRYE